VDERIYFHWPQVGQFNCSHSPLRFATSSPPRSMTEWSNTPRRMWRRKPACCISEPEFDTSKRNELTYDNFVCSGTVTKKLGELQSTMVVLELEHRKLLRELSLTQASFRYARHIPWYYASFIMHIPNWELPHDSRDSVPIFSASCGSFHGTWNFQGLYQYGALGRPKRKIRIKTRYPSKGLRLTDSIGQNTRLNCWALDLWETTSTYIAWWSHWTWNYRSADVTFCGSWTVMYGFFPKWSTSSIHRLGGAEQLTTFCGQNPSENYLWNSIGEHLAKKYKKDHVRVKIKKNFI
jgi:hypothetical protein